MNRRQRTPSHLGWALRRVGRAAHVQGPGSCGCQGPCTAQGGSVFGRGAGAVRAKGATRRGGGRARPQRSQAPQRVLGPSVRPGTISVWETPSAPRTARPGPASPDTFSARPGPPGSRGLRGGGFLSPWEVRSPPPATRPSARPEGPQRPRGWGPHSPRLAAPRPGLRAPARPCGPRSVRGGGPGVGACVPASVPASGPCSDGAGGATEGAGERAPGSAHLGPAPRGWRRGGRPRAAVPGLGRV